MSFEEWWNTKDYPVGCKGNCKEAYEAGLHADVHTDNSAVIAELENKIADIKANCDLAIEGRDIKIKELEESNKELEQKLKVETELSKRLGVAYREYEQLTKEQDEHILELEKKNKKLESDFRICEKNADTYYDQLTKAKEIIKRLKSLIEDVCDINYLSKNNTKLLEQAEQFLNSEVQKC